MPLDYFGEALQGRLARAPDPCRLTYNLRYRYTCMAIVPT